MSSAPNPDRLEDLIDLLLDGELDDAQRFELDALVSADDQAAKALVEAMDQHAMLQWEFGQIEHETFEAANERAMLNEMYEQALDLRRLHEIEDKAQAQLVADLRAQKKKADLERRRAALEHKENNRPTKVIVIPKTLVYLGVAAAMLLGITAFLMSPSSNTPTHPPNTSTHSPPNTGHQTPTPPPVLATLNDSFMPRWSASSRLSGNGKTLHAGQYELLEGQARMTLADGTKLKLIAPVRFELESAGEVTLETGQLVADVPQSAIGFRVQTPAGVIVDLGTTFGIEVMGDNTVEAEVVSGLIRVAARQPDGELTGFVNVLEEGAAKLDGQAGTVAPIQAGGDRFSMDYVRVIDLVDAIAGGDGTTGQRNAGIDPLDGSWLDTAFRDTIDWTRVGDRRFHEVLRCPLIAGTFIPSGEGLPTPIDPAGNTFDRFTVSENSSYGQTWAGGFVPVPGAEPELDTIIDGVNYAAPSRGLVRMYANSGLCFDLAEIRRNNPGLTTTRFRTGLSNREATRQEASNPSVEIYASVDVWVFVDGDLRYNRRDVTTADGMLDIDLPLDTDDQYLTVVITDGLNGTLFDWVLLCQPRIDLTPDGLNPRDRE